MLTVDGRDRQRVSLLVTPISFGSQLKSETAISFAVASSLIHETRTLMRVWRGTLM
jgi:hypothetical protein